MQLFSYWTGEPTWLERLSVASAIATGHKLTVFTDGDCKSLSSFLGCDVEDMREVARFDQALLELRQILPAHFSDHFRLEGLARGLGTWTDLDVIFLQSLPEAPYIFGWQGRGRIGNSVLKLPVDSACLRDYLAFCRQRPMVRALPWNSPRRKFLRIAKIALSSLIRSRLPAPKYGPEALTHFVKSSGLEHWTFQSSVLYPVPCAEESIRRMNEIGFIEKFLTPETLCVHVWRSTYLAFHAHYFPAPGWLTDTYRRLLGSKPVGQDII